ncbi:glycine cleavage system protein R [Glaciecola sp. KUL10]|uniref:glycine cleavage system protein R n=1 Tax=Glaciecola sp. (strain KUL10) TaxID=2161813 RepID=UPI000D783648|nr:ACT domain-containing protein [Glaciecola sp. KUL10]GBL05597.1 ACT domain-containing protein [Glaciecola sp. KUL10]
MHAMVLTLIGKDRAGLVDAIAKCITDADGNWLRSSFCQLSGQFAGFIEVMLPQENQQLLKDSCAKIAELSITLSPSDSFDDIKTQTALVKVTANDRKGIVSDITSALKRFEINIIEMNTTCTSAPNWGNPVFNAEVSVAQPDSVNLDEVQEAIENISDDLMVEIEANYE